MEINMKTLLVVDMQNDFIDGALGTPEAVKIVPNVKKKIEEYEARGDQIFFTRDTHQDYYLETHEGKNLPVVHCIEGTEGWQIPEDLDIKNAHYLDKCSFGWICWNLLRVDGDWVLRNLGDEIEVIGLCTDICVVSNALILRSFYPETDIIVDASCCAGTTPEMHRKALDIMKSCQIKVINE